MVFIHVQVTLCPQRQIEAPMARKQLQHVIKEANSGADLRPPPAFQKQSQLHRSLVRLPLNPCFPHAGNSRELMISSTTSRKASSSNCVCARFPIVIRTQPWQPGSEERS